MAAIVAYTDFQSGPLKLSLSTIQQTDMTAFIATYEKKILRDLLTDKLQADIAAASTFTGKLGDLINGCNYTDSSGIYRANSGLKDVMKQFIYYHYCADNFRASSVGKEKNQNENAAQLPEGVNTQILNRKYNEGIAVWNCELIRFLTEFYSQSKAIDSYTDLGATCQILSADTGYLQTGDTVRINGVEYVVSSVVANTSFIIPGSGLTPSGTYLFYPFEDVVLTEREYAWL